MGTGSWSNDEPRDLVVPSGAGPGDTRIVIGPDVPTVITSFYIANYGGVVTEAWIGEYIDANNYHYEVWFQGTFPLNRAYQAEGWVNAGVVSELWNDFTFVAGSPGIVYGQVTPLSVRYNHAIINIGLGVTDADLQFQSISLPRGVVLYVSSTANSAAIGTTEAFVLSGSAEFPADRAFCATYGWGWQASATGVHNTVRLRETSATGQFLAEFGIMPEAQTANIPYQSSAAGVFVNATGSPITTTVGLGFVAGGAGGTVLQPATATRPRYLRIEDIGEASNYPGAISLT